MPDKNKATSGEQLSQEVAENAAILIRQLGDPLEHRVLFAVRALLQLLANKGFTIHAIGDCVQHGGAGKPEPPKSLNAAEMQALYDKGYHDGYDAGLEYGRKSVVLAGAASMGVFHAGSGINGHTWQEIAEHCARNSHLFTGKNLEFVESVARQVQYRDLSPPQTSWLGDLFTRYCGGKI